jgi:acyl dehydratase
MSDHLLGMTYEEMTVGRRLKTARRTITETDLVNFITLGGFTEPLFWDATHAASAGYSGRLVPGALVYTIAEGLVMQSNLLHGTGMAFLGMQLDVKAPVYVGDTVGVEVEITESRASSKPGRGVVTSRNSVRNQRDEEVLTYTPVRLIRGKS